MRHEQPDKILVEYVISMIVQGYKLDVIKHELKRAGHSAKKIDEVVAAAQTYKQEATHIEKHKHKDHNEKHPHKEYKKNKGDVVSGLVAIMPSKDSKSEKTFASVYFIALLGLMIWTGFTTNAPVLNVFSAFLPSILTIITIFALFDQIENRFKAGMFFIPLILCFLFYYLAVSGTLPLFRTMDVSSITALNFFISMLFVGLVYLIGVLEDKIVEEEKARVVKDKMLEQMKPEEKGATIQASPKQIIEYIQSIEDKSKALNFVIGRVYASRNNGSAALRKKVKIDSEWYNEFSNIRTDNIIEAFANAKKGLDMIHKRLLELQKTEYEIFGEACYKFQNLSRDVHGRNRVIDVLVANDNDPVEIYYQSALDFCSKALDELGRLRLNLPTQGGPVTQHLEHGGGVADKTKEEEDRGKHSHYKHF